MALKKQADNGDLRRVLDAMRHEKNSVLLEYYWRAFRLMLEKNAEFMDVQKEASGMSAEDMLMDFRKYRAEQKTQDTVAQERNRIEEDLKKAKALKEEALKAAKAWEEEAMKAWEGVMKAWEEASKAEKAWEETLKKAKAWEEVLEAVKDWELAVKVVAKVREEEAVKAAEAAKKQEEENNANDSVI